MASVTQYFSRHTKVSLSSSAQLAKGRRQKHLSAHRNRKVSTGSQHAVCTAKPVSEQDGSGEGVSARDQACQSHKRGIGAGAPPGMLPLIFTVCSLSHLSSTQFLARQNASLLLPFRKGVLGSGLMPCKSSAALWGVKCWLTARCSLLTPQKAAQPLQPSGAPTDAAAAGWGASSS